ncbi:LacI family DNA-binding transcriptional regulator [Microbacterium atlanticum]|uniref:LacI family DNA-binding transcriptional regulator n=1 Tax=Microbacterium atlanticum TaxID=2782168 RepID=UPI00188773A3|nr:LacI family DNA-binding transcriptional regulator [Microbacterium atlanticum]
MAVTRNDVARAAGVSAAVVSYVLNDGPRPVSDASRRRVLEAVESLGYRPDGLARSLRMGRTNTLGLVLPDASNPFFAELARSIEDAAYTRGYAVMVCNSADDIERERTYIASLAGRRIDGLILVSATADQDLTDLTDLAIPVVALDRSPDEAPISTIRADNERGAYVGTQHLIEHGHRVIAFVGGPDAGVSDARQDGWRRALDEAQLDPSVAERAAFSFAGGFSAARAVAAQTPAPTAVLVSSDIQALGLLRGLDREGIAVPGDVAVVAIDGTTAGAFAVPPLSSIAQPITEMGAQAVAHLIESPAEVIHRALENMLVVRRSCGCDQEAA